LSADGIALGDKVSKNSRAALSTHGDLGLVEQKPMQSWDCHVMFITEIHFEPKPKRDVGLHCDSHHRNSLLQTSSASHSLLKLTNNHVNAVFPIANVVLVTEIPFSDQSASYHILRPRLELRLP
jgi:hypothetical protein